MAKTEQKGFIVYGDNEEIFDRLTDEEAGKLLKGMVKYFNDGTEPEWDGLLGVVWIMVQLQMDRNADKYKKKCEKNRENIQSYWDKVKSDTNEYERIRPYTNATDRDRDRDRDTDRDSDRETTTDTDTESRGGGSDGDDDSSFDLWKKLDADGIDAIYDVYPDSGGFLIDTVAHEVRTKRRTVKNAVNYVLGYAKRVGWDDKADHFDGGGAS